MKQVQTKVGGSAITLSDSDAEDLKRISDAGKAEKIKKAAAKKKKEYEEALALLQGKLQDEISKLNADFAGQQGT